MALWRTKLQSITLVILLQLLAICHSNPLKTLLSGAGESNALYGPNDKVYLLNVTTVKQTIFNSDRAWFVEFFSSYCGHCINFAPKYKQFAADLWLWRDIVVVAGIDCADDNNTPACREFEIMGYPTLLLFPPNSPELIEPSEEKKKNSKKPLTQVLNTGKQIQKADTMEKLKKHLIQELVQHFPRLLEFSNLPGVSESELWSSDEIAAGNNPSFLLLIYESSSSTVGQEVTLRLNSLKAIKVYRFSQKNQLYTKLGLEGFPAAGYFNKDGTSGPIILGNNENLIDFLTKAAIGLAHIPQSQLTSLGEPKVQDAMVETKSKLLHVDANRDVVSMDDLLHAIRNSLHNEIGLVQFISGHKLTALKKYLHVLVELFPSDRREVSIFLAKLNDWVLSKTEIQNSEFMEKLETLETELQPFDIDLSTWDECKGSIPGRRGYTCGLWRLFHTLTITGVQKNSNEKVLDAIYYYVTNFFGCMECVDHFSKMVHRDKILEVEPIMSQALWLWKAHNEVNLRLKGTPSEDPAFLKKIYPNKSQCEECYIPDSANMDEGKVLQYLVKIYSQPTRVVRDERDINLIANSNSKPAASAVSVNLMSAEKLISEKIHNEKREQSRFSLFSNTDIGIMFIIYASVACLLLVGYLHFKTLPFARRISLRKCFSNKTRFVV